MFFNEKIEILETVLKRKTRLVSDFENRIPFAPDKSGPAARLPNRIDFQMISIVTGSQLQSVRSI